MRKSSSMDVAGSISGRWSSAASEAPALERASSGPFVVAAGGESHDGVALVDRAGH
jgi:hypothetical protein